MRNKNKISRHVIISDLHIPDHNIKAVKAVQEFIKDYQPDCLHILGDFINFTGVSKYDQDPYYHTEINEEIDVARDILADFSRVSKRIIWTAGNHEDRLIRYIGRNAKQLAELNVDDEKIVSIPHIFDLKKLNIEWHNSNDYYKIGNTLLLHGTVVRGKSGYTANAMMDRFAISGISGHTHRLSHTFRTQYGRTINWVETGCLCNQIPTPTYTVNPDWQMGFCILTHNIEKDVVLPQLVPIESIL